MRKVLLVDDNPVNVEILEEIFDGLYELGVAWSGEEAIEQTARFEPDLILLDIMMPGLSGYETCRRIRNLPRGKGYKVIMVSAKAMSSEKIEGLNAGADDYLTKPFDIDELLEKCRQYLT